MALARPVAVPSTRPAIHRYRSLKQFGTFADKNTAEEINFKEGEAGLRTL